MSAINKGAVKDIFHDRHARGRTTTGWLRAQHALSFGSFNDPLRMGFRALRVVNEDIIAGGSGFPEHAHDHFEILTFMLEGEIQHRDSAGHEGRLSAGDVQLISSGSGISHSERNPAEEQPTHLFQIWLHGNQDQGRPNYQLLRGALGHDDVPVRLVASPEPQENALLLRAPVFIWRANASAGDAYTHQLPPQRYGWLQMLDGIAIATADDGDEAMELRGGDALQLAVSKKISLRAQTRARWLWFDLS